MTSGPGQYCQVVTTIDSRDAAQALASTAVRARLAACAQVGGPLDSTYWWEGAVTSAQEWQVVFKTTAQAYPALAEHLRAQHEYEIPEIVCVEIAGDPAYLGWIETQVHA